MFPPSNPLKDTLSAAAAQKKVRLLCLGLVTMALWWQCHSPWWRNHLQVDAVVFESRANAYFLNGWSSTSGNEYQPGALWFFALAKWMSGPLGKFEDFLTALFWLNWALLMIPLAFCYTRSNNRSFWTMLCLVLSAGPILFYRFESLVALLVLTSWGLWRQRDYLSSAALLGVAAATKIYPVILLPLLIRSSYYEEKSSAGLAKTSGSFILGALLVAGTWGLSGGSWRLGWEAAQYHLEKPFGIDGLLGGLVPIAQKMIGAGLLMDPRNGIHGFTPSLGEVVLFILTWLWLPVLIACACLIWRPSRRDPSPSALFMFLYIGAFVVMGKSSNPQYLWWAVSFLPFLASGELPKKSAPRFFSAIFATLILSQIVYPLNYSSLLGSFPETWHENWVFWLNLAKNALFALVVGWSAVILKRNFRTLS